MQVKTKRWVRRAVVAVALTVVVGAGLTVYLLRRPPAVWTQAQKILAQSTPQARQEQAEAVMNRLSQLVDTDPAASIRQQLQPGQPGRSSEAAQSQAEQLLSSVAVDQTHTMQLTNDELVAVVGDLFSDWTSQRGYEVPAGITEPVVLAEGGRLAIAFEVSTPSWSQVFSGYIRLQFKSDGMAIGRVVDLTAGSLPVSVQEVGEMLQKQLPKGEQSLAEQIGDWLSQLDGFEFRPVLELEHRRRARVVDMQVAGDAVTVTMRVQDHETYKRHNALMGVGAVAVTDKLPAVPARDTAIADVPTKTD